MRRARTTSRGTLALGFLKYHNKVVETPSVAELPPERRFDEARRIVRWHYQWAVVHDFLARLVGNDVIDDVLRPVSFKVPAGRGAKTIKTLSPVLKFFHWRARPFMPVEFSVAAYRFGHSMVRGEYELNAPRCRKSRSSRSRQRKTFEASGRFRRGT